MARAGPRPIFVTAVLAPLAGAIASFLRREPRWLCAGALTAAVMGAFMAAVSTGQTGLLS